MDLFDTEIKELSRKSPLIMKLKKIQSWPNISVYRKIKKIK